jgi:Reverse transcriptase (RNA-dependent DNA polymerase)
MAMNPEWVAEIVDVEGAYLQGEFTEGEEIHIEVPQGFEGYYDEDYVLKRNVPLYGMKQAASCFYKKLVKAVKKRNYERSKADPCLYFTWKDGRRVVMLIWIDDNLIVENPCDVAQVKVDWKSTFECKDEGELKEYIGSKTDVVRRDEGTSIKFTQPVLVQSLEDEFDVPSGRAPRAPAPAGQVLKRNDRSNFLERCRRNQIQKWGSQNGVYAAVVTAGYLQFDKRSC